MMSKLLPAAAFVIALLVFFLYVDPTYTGSIADAQSAIAGDNQALAAASQYTAKENELISAEKAIDPDAHARHSTFLPDSANDVGLILDLDALAARDGLSITGIGIENQSPEAASGGTATVPYSSVQLTLNATGSYSTFRSFLASIEQSERLLDVTALTVNGSNTGVYTYTMTLTLYWLH